jgi:hypothetical protein
MKNRPIKLLLVMVFAVTSCFVSGCGGKKGEPAKKAEAPARAGAPQMRAEAKKVFRNGMGGLMIKLAGAYGSDKMQRVRVFKANGPRSSSYVRTFSTNRTQEMLPGVYDIELDTMPPVIYKGVNVTKEKETIEDIGCITGNVTVKAVSVSKKPLLFPVRLFYPDSGMIAAVANVNRTFEVLSGTYDIEIVTAPVQLRKAFVVESGKDNEIDLGMITGILIIRVVDENGVPANYPIRIKKAGTSEFAGSSMTNRPAELVAGVYDIDILTRPVQTQKGVSITVGKETVIDVIIPVPAKPAAPPAKSVVKNTK